MVPGSTFAVGTSQLKTLWAGIDDFGLVAVLHLWGCEVRYGGAACVYTGLCLEGCRVSGPLLGPREV